MCIVQPAPLCGLPLLASFYIQLDLKKELTSHWQQLDLLNWPGITSIREPLLVHAYL